MLLFLIIKVIAVTVIAITATAIRATIPLSIGVSDNDEDDVGGGLASAKEFSESELLSIKLLPPYA